jgi:hypothetical protein
LDICFALPTSNGQAEFLFHWVHVVEVFCRLSFACFMV